MQHLVYFEIGAALIVPALALFRPNLGTSWSQAITRRCDRVAGRRSRAVVFVGLVTLAVSVVLSLIRWHHPRIPDEFSYLLAADTFAHGRLTNPTPPLWEHFESKHILVKPTYQSKYPPAQGLILALGQVVTGHPIVGAWLGMALACAALCWMLQAWVPDRWALLGGLLAALHLGVLNSWQRGRFFYWSQSYWGGAVAMLGGALVFGALRRILREPRARDSVVLAIGLVILANTRPYEGLVASLPVGAVLIGWLLTKKGPSLQVWWKRVALPVVAVLSLGAVALGYYHYRVTGSPFLMPHMVHEATTETAPHLLWSRLILTDSAGDAEAGGESGEAKQPPERRRRFWSERQWKDYKKRLHWNWTFYLGPALTVPLLALPWMIRDRWVLFAGITCGVVILANLGSIAGFPHYFAPVTALVVALVMIGLTRLEEWRWRGRPSGGMLVRGIVTTCFVTFGIALGLHVYFANSNVYKTLWSERRAEVLNRLEDMPGKHLVIVRSPDPEDRSRNDEWVYNEADIQNAKVIWARELDPARNTRLLRYFKDRDVFFLKADTRQLEFGKMNVRVKR